MGGEDYFKARRQLKAEVTGTQGFASEKPTIQKVPLCTQKYLGN